MLIQCVRNQRSKNFSYQWSPNSNFFKRKYAKRLIYLKVSAGRSFGRRRLEARGRCTTTQVLLLLNQSFSGFFLTLLVYDIFLTQFRQRYLVLSYLYGVFGYWFYFWYTTTFIHLGYITQITSDTFRSGAAFPPSIFCLARLYLCPPHSIISLIGNISQQSIRFVRAPGSFGLLLSPCFIESYSLIMLPSKKLKLFPTSFSAFFGHVTTIGIRTKLSSLAGFFVNRGKRPITRGTVKNANDHPNGGRRRSLSPSYTKWGWIAKRGK